MIVQTKTIFATGFRELTGHPFHKFSDMLRVALALIRLQSYLTVHGFAATSASILCWSAEIPSSHRALRHPPPPRAILGDSVPIDEAFDNEMRLAIGMNGETLNRTHGFPLRLLALRHYGFKNVKWISEIRFVGRPCYGTWPKLGYTKEPLVHTASHIDRVVRVRGALRADSGMWTKAVLEPPFSPFTRSRWRGELPASGAAIVEARALDGAGPTIRRIAR